MSNSPLATQSDTERYEAAQPSGPQEPAVRSRPSHYNVTTIEIRQRLLTLIMALNFTVLKVGLHSETRARRPKPSE